MPAYDEIRFYPPAPAAIVTILHPDTGAEQVRVPMVIDTGADATLLPGSAVRSLGLVETGERYQLIAFDGTASESQSVDAFLILLKRRYRGRYLLIDAEVGVIGRDILNHMRVLLDGPALSWEVVPSAKGRT